MSYNVNIMHIQMSCLSYIAGYMTYSKFEKYRISKMRTAKSYWLHVDDGCVMASCHHNDDRFSRTTQGIQCDANAVCALMYSTVMIPNIWLTKHIDHIFSSGDTLYPRIGKCWHLLASDIPTYICMYNYQFKVSEKQSTVGYIKEYLIIKLATVANCKHLTQVKQSQAWLLLGWVTVLTGAVAKLVWPMTMPCPAVFHCH